MPNIYSLPEPSLEPTDDELEVFERCDFCNRTIYYGDDYWQLPDGSCVCEHCMDEAHHIAEEG